MHACMQAPLSELHMSEEDHHLHWPFTFVAEESLQASVCQPGLRNKLVTSWGSSQGQRSVLDKDLAICWLSLSSAFGDRNCYKCDSPIPEDISFFSHLTQNHVPSSIDIGSLLADLHSQDSDPNTNSFHCMRSLVSLCFIPLLNFLVISLTHVCGHSLLYNTCTAVYPHHWGQSS